MKKTIFSITAMLLLSVVLIDLNTVKSNTNEINNSKFELKKFYKLDHNDTNLSINIINNKVSLEQDIIEWFSTIGNIPVWKDNKYIVNDLKNKIYIDNYFFVYDLIDLFIKPFIVVTVKNLTNDQLVGYAKVNNKENNDYEIRSFSNLTDINATSFPLINPDNAKNIIKNELNISSDINFQNELVHINGSIMFHFTTADNKNLYFDVENGYIHDDKFVEEYIEYAKEIKGKELQFYQDQISGEIILKIDEINRNYYSEQDIENMLKDIEIENQAIRNGLLKLDDNLNIIYDNRLK